MQSRQTGAAHSSIARLTKAPDTRPSPEARSPRNRSILRIFTRARALPRVHAVAAGAADQKRVVAKRGGRPQAHAKNLTIIMCASVLFETFDTIEPRVLSMLVKSPSLREPITIRSVG